MKVTPRPRLASEADRTLHHLDLSTAKLLSSKMEDCHRAVSTEPMVSLSTARPLPGPTLPQEEIAHSSQSPNEGTIAVPVPVKQVREPTTNGAFRIRLVRECCRPVKTKFIDTGNDLPVSWAPPVQVWKKVSTGPGAWASAAVRKTRGQNATPKYGVDRRVKLAKEREISMGWRMLWACGSASR